MDKLKTVGVGALVAFAVALVVTYFNAPGAQIVREVVREVTQQLGATPSVADISNGPICIEGYCEWPMTASCPDATSTLAFFQNPFRGATSSVNYLSVLGYSGTSSLVLVAGSSTSANALADAGNLAWFNSGISASTSIGTSTRFVRIGPYREAWLHNVNGAVAAPPPVESVATSTLALIGPDQYVIVKATGSNAAATFDGVGGLLGGNNLFTCDQIRIKFVK